MRLLWIQLAVCFGSFLVGSWFLPHYAAPLTATTFALVVQGMRHLRLWQFQDRPVGIALSRLMVLLPVALAPFHRPLYLDLHPHLKERVRIERELHAMPGDHLVIVRYSPSHDNGEEWVWNRADIDRANIVWARDIPGISLDSLLAYFHGRGVWLLEPDKDVPTLSPYQTLQASK